MNRKHAFVIALVIALAAIAGLTAALRTVGIGRTSATAAQIGQRNRALSRAEAALKHALAERPPKLPALPAAPSAASTPVSASAPAPATTTPASASTPAPRRVVAAPVPKIVYVRPKPIVVTRPRAGGEDEHEADESHESDDGLQALGGDEGSENESGESDD